MACPVCFGDANAPMTVAANNGIWFMLGIVVVMLSAFATFFIHLMRRAKTAANQEAAGETAPYGHRQEGTV